MKTRVHLPSPATMRRLATALRRGELVALPTETVYGLAANALSARACRKIFTAKRRPADDPLIVHVESLVQAEKLALFNPMARRLAEVFWPGPLTLVLTKRPAVPDIVTSGQPTVALRVPAHPLARELVRLAGVPLAAPSANPFGYVSPTTAAHVLDGLGGRIPHVLDGGASPVGVESTIVDLSDTRRAVVLRPGAIGVAALRRALRGFDVRISTHTKRRAMRDVLSPGLLDQHYSPHTPLKLVRQIVRSRWGDEETGLLLWRRPVGSPAPNRVRWLTERGAAAEAARHLYARLRELDQAGYRRLLVETAPTSAGALGAAINDRLRRAAGKRRS